MDGEIFKTALFFLLFSTVVVLFVVLSSTYFIRSIVTPIGQVGVIATKIASGDFSVRLKTQHNDEIGQLCNIINYMADELQKAEEVKNDFISQVSHEPVSYTHLDDTAPGRTIQALRLALPALQRAGFTFILPEEMAR